MFFRTEAAKLEGVHSRGTRYKAMNVSLHGLPLQQPKADTDDAKSCAKVRSQQDQTVSDNLVKVKMGHAEQKSAILATIKSEPGAVVTYSPLSKLNLGIAAKQRLSKKHCDCKHTDQVVDAKHDKANKLTSNAITVPKTSYRIGHWKSWLYKTFADFFTNETLLPVFRLNNPDLWQTEHCKKRTFWLTQ